jgi:hypothetical protein
MVLASSEHPNPCADEAVSSGKPFALVLYLPLFMA